MRILHRGFAASAVGCLVALGGCGGGGETPAVAPADFPPLTKEEFLFEADRICFATESQIDAAASAAFIGAGLLSVLVFPITALALLRR